MSSSHRATTKTDIDDYELSPLLKKIEAEKFASLVQFRIRLIQSLPEVEFWGTSQRESKHAINIKPSG